MKAVPQAIKLAAESRLASTVQTQQKKVEEALTQGRPLDAEDDNERKVAFISRAVGVDPVTAERIAAYEDPRNLRLNDVQVRKAESLQGGTVDFVPIDFLDIGRAASRSIARVSYDIDTPYGTGFMVSPRLFMTNNHVIRTAKTARSLMLEFNYERDSDRNLIPVTRFALDPDRFFYTNKEDDLDFTLVAVGDKLEGPWDLSAFGFLPLLDTMDKHIKGMFTNIIQHPNGRPKELVVRENHITGRTANTLLYGADTLPGSSGSPVFNDNWEIIALHHYGTPFRALVDVNNGNAGNDGDAGPNGTIQGNEGIRISAIIRNLTDSLSTLPPQTASMLEEALNPAFRRPSLAGRIFGEQGTGPGPSPGSPPPIDSDDRVEEDNSGRGRTPSSPPYDNQSRGLMPTVGANGEVTWMVPLVVSVRLGSGAASPSQGAAVRPDERPATTGTSGAGEAQAFKFVPDSDYSNRQGYNPGFLGIMVSLPTLNAAQKKVAARNLNAGSGDDPLELKYSHFSVVVNRARRLPFFTAVNIDGASVVRINRKTGEITHVEAPGESSAEAREKWYIDPRIKADEQSDQSLYDDPLLDRFQRGHLVKRTNPSWGNVDIARNGQADTFHFTNCAPQHELFNPKTTRWAGVENWITNGSDNEDLRLTVFSGPVFANDDPQLSYIRVPRRFWKVIVRVEDGELLATAILADQSDLLEDDGESAPGVGSEDLPVFPTKLPADYQCTVRRIEELTGLDFGPLRDHDTFSGPEGASQERLIHDFEDITIRRAYT